MVSLSSPPPPFLPRTSSSPRKNSVLPPDLAPALPASALPRFRVEEFIWRQISRPGNSVLQSPVNFSCCLLQIYLLTYSVLTQQPSPSHSHHPCPATGPRQIHPQSAFKKYFFPILVEVFQKNPCGRMDRSGKQAVQQEKRSRKSNSNSKRTKDAPAAGPGLAAPDIFSPAAGGRTGTPVAGDGYSACCHS